MNVLYLLAASNIYGGTPKKTLGMVKHTRNNYLMYFWSDAYKYKQELLRKAGAKIYTGALKKNVWLRKLIRKLKGANPDFIHYS